MCGIAGCYQQADGQKLVDIMTDRIAHRGPDSRGSWSHEDDRLTINLGFRRLSIIDLSAAADQPMTKDGLTLVFNGELYNYRALRAELTSRGVAFATESDTEVVLEAWRCWGPAALNKFRGMFAFALADPKSGELTLARDPFGIKPLYYLPRGDGLVFASELKALVAATGSELRIEPGALVASMLYYWLPEQRCAIDRVRKLPGGSWARCRADGTITVQQYWRIADVAAQAAAGEQADLGPVIEESVAAHLVADVPVSSFLSGGLDSSIVTVLAHRANTEIDAYTIAFRPQDQRLEAMPDDAVYARKVAAQFGIKLHEIEVSPDIVSTLPRMVDVLDEPIGDPAAINTLLMCEAARERGVKVILSGMGADELFGGYRKHLACLLASRYASLPGGLRKFAVQATVNRLPVTMHGRGLRYARWAKRFMTFAELPEEPRFRRSYTLYDPDELAALIDPQLAPYVGQIIDEHAEVYHDNDLQDEVNRMCLADTRLFLPGLNLAYTDRASMAASIEVRVPFVDPVVAAAAFSLDGSSKIKRREGKVALKRVASQWLPDEIVHRPKASFSAPLRAWVRGDLHEVIQDVLVKGELVSGGMIGREALLQLISDEQAGREDRSKQIWQLLTLELWYRNVQSLGVTA
ncbi:MAG TPA: asparagine synthase (glutamine-hydrolyzing) [Streptosporangiaceae bacterium]|jgi:asparagine synthase (glutamine-hydrolysing)|nr:asparagine synthase (glutamine-hydrolyzing) [Streptosporangiaceae bacterium]